MGWNLRVNGRKSIIPGLLYLNIGKKSMSLTAKAGPVSRTYSTSGRRTTNVSLPGPLSMRDVSTKASRTRKRALKLAELQERKAAALARREARRNGQ